MVLFPTTEPRFNWPGATPEIPSIALDHRLIEQGRHDELMALRGTYFELFTLQARAYADDPDTAPAGDNIPFARTPSSAYPAEDVP